jgi:methylenetetrahydrofolate dehydrogenase (NADP+)/methenyltetrahydrofolate cyclohydrolase
MTARIIDGKSVAESIRTEIAAEVAHRVGAGARPPGLAVVIVGEDPASLVYVRNKRRAAEAAGFHSVLRELPATTAQAELHAEIDRLNADPRIDAILCQSPLPKGLDESAVVLRIDPEKDVDGFHPIDVGRLASGLPGFVPCTPLGIIELLKRYEIPTRGRRAVVLGRSHIVGTPMALLLMRKGEGGDATVTVCHSRTVDLAAECARADILISAIGRPGLVTAEMVKEGAAVFDVGINRIDDPSAPKGYRLVGDVDFDAVKEKAGAITPVPGGVGPMTIAILLRSALEAWRGRVAS